MEWGGGGKRTEVRGVGNCFPLRFCHPPLPPPWRSLARAQNLTFWLSSGSFETEGKTWLNLSYFLRILPFLSSFPLLFVQGKIQGKCAEKGLDYQILPYCGGNLSRLWGFWGWMHRQTPCGGRGRVARLWGCWLCLTNTFLQDCLRRYLELARARKNDCRHKPQDTKRKDKRHRKRVFEPEQQEM